MDAPITNYAELVQALLKRVDEAGTTFSGLDVVAGLPDRHAAAVLAPLGRKCVNAAHLLFIIQALGLKLQLVPDDEALARLRQRSDWHELRRSGPRYRPPRKTHQRASLSHGGPSTSPSVIAGDMGTISTGEL